MRLSGYITKGLLHGRVVRVMPLLNYTTKVDVYGSEHDRMFDCADLVQGLIEQGVTMKRK